MRLPRQHRHDEGRGPLQVSAAGLNAGAPTDHPAEAGRVIPDSSLLTVIRGSHSLEPTFDANCHS
jgi:hypothetical protein